MSSKKITEIRKDSKQKCIAEKLLNRFSEIKKNDDENFKIQNVGEEYTNALFSPVSAIMLTMADVYGTFALPVTCIDTDIASIDLSAKDTFPVSIRIVTTQPGLMCGENNEYIDMLKNKLAEVFHISSDKLSVRFVSTEDIHIVDF